MVSVNGFEQPPHSTLSSAAIKTHHSCSSTALFGLGVSDATANVALRSVERAAPRLHEQVIATFNLLQSPFLCKLKLDMFALSPHNLRRTLCIHGMKTRIWRKKSDQKNDVKTQNLQQTADSGSSVSMSDDNLSQHSLLLHVQLMFPRKQQL